MSFIFILKKPNDTIIRYVPFDERPSWEILASKVAEVFHISPDNVRVIFSTSDGGAPVEEEQQLQYFYKVVNPSSGQVKGIVQGRQTTDPQNAITSTWSTGSDLSNLFNADDRLTLFCWVLNVSDNPFSVDIEKSMTVGHLKKLIKKKNEHTFGDIDAHTLELWKLSPPIPSEEVDTKLKDVQSSQGISGCVNLNAMDELSKHFSLASRNHLHIIVEVPPRRVFSVTQTIEEFPDLEEQHAKSVRDGRGAAAPSSAAQVPLFKQEQAKRPVMNGRPPENHGLPVHLFHPAFSLFQHTLADPNIDLSSSDYAIAHSYMSASAEVYESESQRYDATLGYLRGAILFNILRIVNNDKTSGSFVVLTPNHGNAIAGLYELKNEVGAGRSDPTIQGSLSYRKTWVSPELDSIRRSCCCPSFILSIAGPWMCISGAIFIENVVVQQLTNYVWTGGNPYDDKALESVARIFKALSVGLKNLRTFYEELKIVNKPDLQRMFPFTRFYFDALGQQVNFDYCERLSTTKAVFLAKRTFDNKQLIVKFVQRYNSVAHHLLAFHDLAPQLHYSSLDDPNSKTLGALGVVVMDYAGDSDAYKLYPNGLPNVIYEGVEQAIHILHKKSIVFGDLRLPNIVITKQGTPMLVDFDWCGKHGIARYPSSLNDSSCINWHEGVARNGVMHKEHDTFMLKAMRLQDHEMDCTS